MIHDTQHAALLQERHDARRFGRQPVASVNLRTLSALACLLRHFTGSDDGVSQELHDAASDCVGDETRADGGSDVADLIAEWRYDDPRAALTYLSARLSPRQVAA